MIRPFQARRVGPIGVDLGSRCVKLIQFNADRTRVLEAARWDLSGEAAPEPEARWRELGVALRQAREGRNFRGRDAVVCLGMPELFVQNVRVAKSPGGELDKMVRQEASGRVPFPATEAEIRYVEAADVRQGDTTKREVIVLACHRPKLNRLLDVVSAAGLRPVAVDAEPTAMLRCYAQQFRRDEDQQQRAMFAHIGASNTVVVIAHGADALFIKYVDVGGQQMDEAVARHLDMSLAEATTLRRHNGDRRVDQQDPDVARSVTEAIRPVLERLAVELAMCARYHSVTFRGQPLARIVISGGEATPALIEAIGPRLDAKCELGDPLRSYEIAAQAGRKGQWDVATGLALRELGEA
jgi:type IV pilus assembly protein PilM